MPTEPRRDLPIPLRVELRLPDGSTRVEYAVNVSPGGLCLHLSRPLPEDEVLEVALTIPPDGPRIEARGRVAWTSWRDGVAADDFWETGLQFTQIDESTREEIQAFASQPKDRRR